MKRGIGGNFPALLLFALPLFFTTAKAGEYYRKYPQKRFLGSNQGNVGSCQAEADVAALESVFAMKNLAVRLSSFYRHARNWAQDASNPAKLEGTRLEFNPADLALVARAGAFIPEYMLPEDSEGFNPFFTGNRPHISEMGIVDPGYAAPESMGYRQDFYTFSSAEPYSNFRNLDQLKAVVAAGSAVSIAIQGRVLEYMGFDPVTGLLSSKYDPAKIRSQAGKDFFADGTNHSVAVVGFDDSLYANQGYSIPGAVIIRNSWNSAEAVASAGFGPFTDDQTKALQSFRYKLNPNENMPGYLALPYEFILDHFRRNIGGFTVYSLNYEAFAEQYHRLKPLYEVAIVPFSCEGDVIFGGKANPAKEQTRRFGTLLEKARNAGLPIEERQAASQDLVRILQGESATRLSLSPRSTFDFAKLPRHLVNGVDRVADFYSGKFLAYYCAQYTALWPHSKHYMEPAFRSAIVRLSSAPYELTSWFAVMNTLFRIGAMNEN